MAQASIPCRLKLTFAQTELQPAFQILASVPQAFHWSERFWSLRFKWFVWGRAAAFCAPRMGQPLFLVAALVTQLA